MRGEYVRGECDCYLPFPPVTGSARGVRFPVTTVLLVLLSSMLLWTGTPLHYTSSISMLRRG